MSLDRVTAEDRLMLATSETWPQDIGALAVLDGGRLFDATGELRVDAVRDAIECPNARDSSIGCCHGRCRNRCWECAP